MRTRNGRRGRRLLRKPRIRERDRVVDDDSVDRFPIEELAAHDRGTVLFGGAIDDDRAHVLSDAAVSDRDVIADAFLDLIQS